MEKVFTEIVGTERAGRAEHRGIETKDGTAAWWGCHLFRADVVDVTGKLCLAVFGRSFNSLA